MNDFKSGVRRVFEEATAESRNIVGVSNTGTAGHELDAAGQLAAHTLPCLSKRRDLFYD